MSRTLDESVLFQFQVWGYAITGEATSTVALVAELRPHQIEFVEGLWDRDWAFCKSWTRLESGKIIGPAPYHWALPGVAKLRLMQASKS